MELGSEDEAKSMFGRSCLLDKRGPKESQSQIQVPAESESSPIELKPFAEPKSSGGYVLTFVGLHTAANPMKLHVEPAEEGEGDPNSVPPPVAPLDLQS